MEIVTNEKGAAQGNPMVVKRLTGAMKRMDLVIADKQQELVLVYQWFTSADSFMFKYRDHKVYKELLHAKLA